MFFARRTSALGSQERHFSLSAEDTVLLNPNTRTCPIFRTRRDAEITKAIYRRVPLLITDGPPQENPWGLHFMAMFHMSSDSHLFRTRDELNAGDWRPQHGEFHRGADRLLPIYEAKMVGVWNHRAASILLNPNNPVRQAQSTPSSAWELKDPSFRPTAQFFVQSTEAERRIPDYWKQQWFFAFKRVTSTTNERTLIGCVIPRGPVSYSLVCVLPRMETVREWAALYASMNSFPADYFVRQKTGQPSLPLWAVEQIPSPATLNYQRDSAWFGGQAASDWLVPRILELTYTSWDMAPFARDLGYGGPPFPWDPERRFALRCELDAAFFHLYGIERDDVGYIMDTFPIVKRRDEAKYAEYRTKQVILGIYDAMTSAMATGVPYQGSEARGAERIEAGSA
jgi:hypothetical protein